MRNLSLSPLGFVELNQETSLLTIIPVFSSNIKMLQIIITIRLLALERVKVSQGKIFLVSTTKTCQNFRTEKYYRKEGQREETFLFGAVATHLTLAGTLCR